ncbi:MAG: hypothetical protein K2I93_06515 [Oscillospiraceae bacterium]|nr:hypothetical protein [Oscillospiraceae bacterium]
MKRIQAYLPNVLLTFLLVFALLAAELVLFVSAVVFNPAVFRTVAEQEALADKAYATLEADFTSRSNSTGIPAEVFLDAIDHDALHEGIIGSTEQAFTYLNGKSETYDFMMDFTDLEASVRAFFVDYANENGFARDTAFEEKVAAVIEESEAEVLFVTDTFKFGTMYRNGWLTKAQKYVRYLQPAIIGCLALTAILVILLILCNSRQKLHLAYWFGLAALTSGLLLLVPCIYLTATDYFSAFALKDPQIFAAVVGYLRLLTKHALVMAATTFVSGAAVLGGFGAASWKLAKRTS